jgi:hypothetical protein
VVVEKLDKEIQKLQQYLNCPVHVGIQGEQDEEQAPLFRKKLFQVETSSEGTHLKFFFDAHTFVAVPLESNSWWNDEQLTAYDEDKKLKYCFHFVEVNS